MYVLYVSMLCSLWSYLPLSGLSDLYMRGVCDTHSIIQPVHGYPILVHARTRRLRCNTVYSRLRVAPTAAHVSIARPSEVHVSSQAGSTYSAHCEATCYKQWSTPARAPHFSIILTQFVNRSRHLGFFFLDDVNDLVAHSHEVSGSSGECFSHFFVSGHGKLNRLGFRPRRASQGYRTVAATGDPPLTPTCHSTALRFPPSFSGNLDGVIKSYAIIHTQRTCVASPCDILRNYTLQFIRR